MTLSELTAYQTNVCMALTEAYDETRALQLIAKHAALIENRERRRFEPFATARAILEAEAVTEGLRRVEEWNDQFRQPNPDGRFPICKPVVGDKDSRCERCGNVGLSGRPCPAVPPEQRWGENQSSDDAVCSDIDTVITEIYGDGIIRNDAPQDRILSRGAASAIADKIATINRLVAEVCEYKRTHILERVGYYPHSPGSLLNAYREGDLDFDTAVALLKAPDLSQYERALIFAARAHGDQKRRYTGEPYLVHPIAVAALLAEAGLKEYVVVAGLLHDVTEDGGATLEQIAEAFGPIEAHLVFEASSVSGPDDGSRKKRKELDLVHYGQASDDGQSIKVADLISNIPSIVEYDPKFAKVYLPEKRALLAVLTRANPNLLRRAWEVLESGERRLFKS